MLFRNEAFRRHRIHFIGIGGVGMSGIAEILVNLGYTVTGSDLRASEFTKRLRDVGACVHIGHDAGNVNDPDAVVTSSAIPDNNPELLAARRKRLPVISRGELLAELMRTKFGIAVAGSHGKTSTTSICAAVLAAGGLDPTVAVGGRVAAMGSNARLGKSDYLLVEADESDGSFLVLDPVVGVITNIDREHMDYYGTQEKLLEAFEEFANNVPFYGAIVICADDPLARFVASRARRRCRTYGLLADSHDADLVANELEFRNGQSSFRLALEGRDLGRFEVQGVGLHTVRNAMAAVLVGTEVEIPLERIRRGLAQFRGVDRRFQKRGEERGVTVIDDYGHHPTEIRTTLEAAALLGYRAVNVIFQPHRYTRTRELENEFAECFGGSDRLWVIDIYAAGEDALPGVCSPDLVDRIVDSGHPCVEYSPSMQDAVRSAAEAAGPGEVVITLGAGNVWLAGEELLARLREQGPAERTGPPATAPVEIRGEERPN